MEVIVGGKTVKLSPAKAIGKGGEADVYKLGTDLALKIFKSPTHPDVVGDPVQERAAGDRLNLQQNKLPNFPVGLPEKVLGPVSLATDSTGKIVGYAMPLLSDAEVLARYSDRNFRQTGISGNAVIEIFKDLWQTLRTIHQKDVVIGDFNDLNVLVKDNQAYFIDTDSFQFDRFPCLVFTLKFLDPILSEVRNKQIMQVKAFDKNSDWYSFAVMFFESLLFVNPFGGVYRPKQSSQRILPEFRAYHRISVYDPEVRYPNSALSPEAIPDELNAYFQNIFGKNLREVFPRSMLEELRWTICTSCGREHARAFCPKCAPHAPDIVRVSRTIRGNVTSELIFKTRGRILASRMGQGSLLWLYHEDGEWKREDGAVVMTGQLLPGLGYDVSPSQTMILQGNNGMSFRKPSSKPERLAVETTSGLPQAGFANDRRFWLQDGFIQKDGEFGRETIGEILSGQTRFWVGPDFGFGFYRAAHLSIAFVFDAKRRGVKDGVKIPGIAGQLVSARCFFAEELCWFFVLSRFQGRSIAQCSVIRSDGEVPASAVDGKGEIDWLASISGKVALKNTLFAATELGIIRLELIGNKIVETRRFPDTADFAHNNCELFLESRGILVVDEQEIRLLRFQADS